jgi:hypothetical protein
MCPVTSASERPRLRLSVRWMCVAREVAVAEVEPRGFAVPGHPLQGFERVSLYSPARLFVDHSRKRVGERVDVGADAKPEKLDVIARVRDDRDLFGRYHAGEAEQELGRADAARKGRDFHHSRPTTRKRPVFTL